jgi:hypothetical protein
MPLGTSRTEQGSGADALQPTPCSGFRARLTAGVRVRPLTVQQIVLAKNHTWTTV